MAYASDSVESATSESSQLRRIIGDITVVIPTVGRPILERCLHSLATGTVLPARAVIVDQGNNPAVGAWLRDVNELGLETLHVVSSGRSPASARNAGLNAAQTHFIAATDDDCLAAPNWLANMEELLHAHPTAIVTGRMEPAGAGRPPTTVTSTVPRVYSRPSVRILSPLQTANMGFSQETAGRIGPFDENLKIAEDNDWAYRALCMGITIVYEPALRVDHFHWRDSVQLRAQLYLYARDQGVFYGKHLRNGDWSMVARTALSLYRGARALIGGFLANDHGRRVSGYATTTRLLPGVYAGLRSLPSP